MKCTPEYNAETKRLQKEAADLRAVVKAIDDGDFGKVIRAKAKEFASDKALDSQGVVDKVREYVNQYAEHTKGEVADAISGYGHEPKPRTLSEDQQRMKEIQKELRDASRMQESAKGIGDEKKTGHEKRLRSEIADLQRQIDYGESAPKEKRALSTEIQRLKNERDLKRRELENLTPAPGAHLPKDPNETFNQREKTRLENRMQDLRERIANQDGSNKATPNVTPNAETLQLREELKALEAEHTKLKPSPPPTGPKENPQERARRSALQRELQEVKDRIASGNYDKPPREPREWSPRTKQLMADVAAEKLQLEKLKHSLALKNRTKTEKIKDLTLATSRSAILMGYHVLGKLLAYSATEIATAPLRGLVSEAYRHVPGLKDVFEKAPVSGGGFNLEAQKKNWSTLLNAETRKAARDRLIRGFSDEDSLYGKKKDFQTPHPLLEMSGRLHDFIKTPTERSGFEMANSLYLAADLREMLRQDPSLTKEEAMDRATSPEAIAARETKAYAWGKERVLKGDSELVNAWRAGLRMMAGKEGDARYRLTRGIKAFFDYMEPIIKVPANLVSETVKYSPVGVGKAILASKELKNMSEAEAEYIADNLVKGTVGSLAMAAYWYGRHGMTGYAQDGDYKKHPDREPDTATIGGHKVGKWAFHHPLTAIGQLIATVGRVYDEKHSLGEGAMAGAKGLVDTLPFVNTIEYNGDSLKDLPHFGKFLGKQASNFIPQAVKELAKDTDPAKRRTTKTGVDIIKSNVPGLREELPRG